MGKKRTSGGAHSSGSPIGREQQKEQKKQRLRARRRRQMVMTAAIVLLGIGAVAAVIAAVNEQDRRTRDLSVVGSGVPAVVQVHDIACPVCNELRDNVESIEDEYADDDLALRVADIATDEGLAFARRYTENRRVTLLFFDGEGNLVDEQVGLRSPEELRNSFAQHMSR
ncbi:MAG: thioredoxin family protein [Alkalispirochaeta sp.]